ncbi:hypothetical protein [Paenibacillus piri]|uniref:Uncharacterized protein n=1 Tax=Paenibacillus piri TaxID=2547395 RepID=A0A4R5KJ85_9BACL|nr:hypothetical protein [Paenibacillus piri]TDF94858.1 hypothetical protein E1757_23195 [Paenibacillus piri]
MMKNRMYSPPIVVSHNAVHFETTISGGHNGGGYPPFPHFPDFGNWLEQFLKWLRDHKHRP